MPFRNQHAARRAGFTLIELLTVMAVLGILMAILIPVVGGAKNSAKKAKTKVQFSQWALAIEGFRQEYGYYPGFSFADGAIDDEDTTKEFVQALTGKKLDGTSYSSSDPGYTAGNTKHIRFCSFSDDDLSSSNELQDAFGKGPVVVLMDKNQDGLIKIADASSNGDYQFSSLVSVNGAVPLVNNEIVRATVIFYSPGAGGSSSDTVTSWK